MSPESEDIYIQSMLDHYSARPKSLEKISLAEFAADFKSHKTKSVDDIDHEILRSNIR